jgi:hypothetical protein
VDHRPEKQQRSGDSMNRSHHHDVRARQALRGASSTGRYRDVRTTEPDVEHLHAMQLPEDLHKCTYVPRQAGGSGYQKASMQLLKMK